MSLEEALKILEEYDEGCPPEGRESLSCGCGECAVEKGKKGGKSEDGEADPIGIDTSAKTQAKALAKKGSVRKKRPAKKPITKLTAKSTAKSSAKKKKKRTSRANKRA